MAMAAARLSRRTQTDPLAYFTPTQPQLDFLSHTSRIRLARSGNQIGKTTMGLVDLIYRALGSHPYQLVRAAPIEAWILCQSWESSLSIQGKLWELLPKDCLALDTEYTAGKGFRGKTPVVRLRNGSIIRVRTVAQGTLALAGSTIDVCLIDEPCPESVYNEIIPRVFARNGVVMITLTPVGADLKWLKALVEAGIVTDMHFPLTPENTRPIGAREPRKTQAQIRKFKASTGEYLWQPPAQLGATATLMNFPIIEAEDMPDIAAGSFSLAFADFNRCYLIVDRVGIRVLRDPYSTKPYVLFYTTKRVGGGIQDFDAIKLLKFDVS
jgi:phage terminase large subunit-like protein